MASGYAVPCTDCGLPHPLLSPAILCTISSIQHNGLEAAIPEAWNKRTTGGNERKSREKSRQRREGGPLRLPVVACLIFFFFFLFSPFLPCSLRPVHSAVFATLRTLLKSKLTLKSLFLLPSPTSHRKIALIAAEVLEPPPTRPGRVCARREPIEKKAWEGFSEPFKRPGMRV